MEEKERMPEENGNIGQSDSMKRAWLDLLKNRHSTVNSKFLLRQHTRDVYELYFVTEMRGEVSYRTFSIDNILTIEYVSEGNYAYIHWNYDVR